MKEERSLLKEWDHILEFSKNKYKYDLVLTEILKENDYQKVKSYKKNYSKLSRQSPWLGSLYASVSTTDRFILTKKKNYIYKQKFYFIVKKMVS